MPKKLYYIAEDRFYPCRDIGVPRRPVNVGDKVKFTFYHEDTKTVARITQINEHNNGRKSYNLEQIEGGL